MEVAYLDTSCMAAILFREPESEELARQLDNLGLLVSSNLLEAELRAAYRREGGEDDLHDYLAQVTWIYPHRPLTRELRALLSAGHARGADLWHLACALFLAPKVGDLAYASLDHQQRALARRVGFKLLPA